MLDRASVRRIDAGLFRLTSTVVSLGEQTPFPLHPRKSSMEFNYRALETLPERGDHTGPYSC